MSAKTSGQVLYEAYTGACEIDPIDHAALAGVGPDYPLNSIGNRSERAAAAVIAHHEATRPAWPPMRPMSDSDLANHVDILLAYEREREPGFKRTHIEIARQTLRGYWTTATYHAPFQQCVGWWPLPEVQQ